MKDHSVRVGVVIATRNRPQEIRKLLTSLSQSTVCPVEVAIVASGTDIREIIQQFSKNMKIKYRLIDTGGQVTQKKAAISLLDRNLDWCLFSDDDVIFDSDAIRVAIKTAESLRGTPAVGVGFALTPTARVVHASQRKRRIAKLIGLDSHMPGRVLKSGHGVSYLESTEDIETEWLNGISMWRIHVIQNYQHIVPAMMPASCEDLVFSYASRRLGKLIFASQARVNFQESEMTNSEHLEVLNSAALWRLYLVKSSPDFSMFSFLLSQLARLLYVLSRPRNRLSTARIRYLLWFGKFVLFALRIGSMRNLDQSLEFIQRRTK